MFPMNFLKRPQAGKRRLAWMGEGYRQIKGSPTSCEKVEVFNFTRYDGNEDRVSIQQCKRTAADIKLEQHCVVIKGTGEWVSRSQLDDKGRYYPSKRDL